MEKVFTSDNSTLYCGDSTDVLAEIPANSVSMIATDPPYGWGFMGKNWDKALPDIAIWRQCYRVLKPGAALCVMSGPRLDCLWRICRDIEEAGFELEQTALQWIYSNGFPKGIDLSKMADRRAGEEREVVGKRERHGGGNNEYMSMTPEHKASSITAPATDLAERLGGQYTKGKIKPAYELIIWARVPISEDTEFDNVVKHGTGSVNCGECMVPYEGEFQVTGGTWDSQIKSEQFGVAGERHQTAAGRYPANVLVTDNALGEGSKYFNLDAWAAEHGFTEEGWTEAAREGLVQCPKASKSEKEAGCGDLNNRIKIGNE